jgi:hypothetical protein
LYIYANVDNPNLIVCGLRYGVSDIRRIESDNRISDYYNIPIRLIHYDLLHIHNFLAHKILAIYTVCSRASKTLTAVMCRASFVTI